MVVGGGAMCRARFSETILYPRGSQHGDSWNLSGRWWWGMNSTLLCIGSNSCRGGEDFGGRRGIESMRRRCVANGCA
jgi:hypothetical protein